MNKIHPIILVVVLSGCGKSPYEQCVEDLNSDSTNYRPIMEKMTKIQKDRLRATMREVYYKNMQFCRALHSK